MTAVLEESALEQLRDHQPPCLWVVTCSMPATRVGRCPRCHDVTLLCEQHARWVAEMRVVHCEPTGESCDYVGPGTSYGWLPL